MSKVTFYDYTEEDYRKLMLRSSRIDGKSYLKPLIDTDHEKWTELFDCTQGGELESDYLMINLVTIIISIITILLYHFY